MAASRTKAPAIGSAQWILDERHQSNDLVAQEMEDFSFSVRNELEWLNEHMADIFAYNGQNNLDVFKTPGKLRGKTPRTVRKNNALARQPLADIATSNQPGRMSAARVRLSPAELSLENNLQKQVAKPRFLIAEDTVHAATSRSPVAPSPAPRPLFSKGASKGKENHDSGYHAGTSEDDVFEQRPALSMFPLPPQKSFAHSTQDTVPSTQEDTQVFTQDSATSTQATQSFRRSVHISDDERRDTGESFVSAKEDFASKNASKENLRDEFKSDAMDVDARHDATQTDAQDTVIHHDVSSIDGDGTLIQHQMSNKQRQIISDAYSTSAETQQALDIAHQRAQCPEPKRLVVPSEQYSISTETHAALDAATTQDDTVIHNDIEDQMDVDDDIRSPSDGSSPVKPLVRKSSLTFASLPAREPLLAKKSMGNRVSRTSHVDQNKARSSQMGRFTGGKSLGGSQHAHAADTQNQDAMDLDEDRPELRREESETTKLHNKTSTMRLAERINMLNQKPDHPKRASQSVMAAQSQTQNLASSQTVSHPLPTQQPTYPHLPAGPTPKETNETHAAQIDDEDDDWISPIRATAPAPPRPILSKSYSADMKPPTTELRIPKAISVSNPDLSTVVESTTPAGSPTGKKYVDGPLSASKAKFYSALRAAKEKIIGSSATSAQVKLDALAEGQMRPKLQAQLSDDDVFSPKRNEKAGTSLFSHLRSPSKESLKTNKSIKMSAMPGSPTKEDGRRTRSSSEREKQKERETREKETKQKQRVEERLREIRDKEQSKAAAHYQKAKASAKTPVAASVPQAHTRPLANATKTPVTVMQQPLSRPGTTRTNTAPRQHEPDSADDMPPPPPPKSQLPTAPSHKLREPKRMLTKAASKDALPKGKPPKVMVNLHKGYGGHTLGTAKSAPNLASRDAPAAPKPAPAPKPNPLPASRPAPVSKAPPIAKAPPPRVGRPPAQAQAAPQPSRMAEKPKPAPSQLRGELAAARPVSRMQTVQDANRINVPPVNPAKPAKRPFQPENDEPLHRPAKRPSQLAKSKPPVTPAHAQFAQGKIPFAESTQPPSVQYPNGEEIKLPEIMTDSEDEDSENEFEQPSWADTPNLRQMLEQQQLVDPEHIFGPIAPLNMEQVFPNKERHKRFRERTSSAYWTHDQVTEEEKRKNREAQERLVKDGAWTYHPSPGPSALR
ncbi:hypothetical protein EJ04DRAFT_483836 [Polyplosphaeria fusca]|uniref:Inner centromere protein ARK-binding domain-containing protein n=1 Tax=Polyplosphaeria fusca TaxID=682080 RepID=A0A9P4RAZ0_9PLEO|nr:hypothetical protein EJ04DRAFT_483836 [Polyplosphaeria fusca]